MANEVKKVNTIAIADIKNINTITDADLKKINTLEFTGTHTNWLGAKGFLFGGYSGGASQAQIDTWNISSYGSVADFGDLGQDRQTRDGFSDKTYVGTFGGYSDSESYSNNIDYITAASYAQAEASSVIGHRAPQVVTNGTRAVRAGGGSAVTAMLTDSEYVTIASRDAGGDTGFDINSPGARAGAAISNQTYGVIHNGYDYASDAYLSELQRFSITASSGTADNFGDSQVDAYGTGGCEDGSRGIMMGGTASGGKTNMIQIVDIGGSGGATDSGEDLAAATSFGACVSDGTKGQFVSPASDSNGIQQVTIQSLGTASDPGDVTTNLSGRYFCGGASGT